ncbi:MAG: hypothetical protein R8P61_33720 [Bacteroidia bacterium]|nr:hypothetical protein [Bacteroidia bacterium]
MRKVSLFFLGSILSISLSAQEVLKQADFGIQKDSVIGYVKNWRGNEFHISSQEYWIWKDWQRLESQIQWVWDYATESLKPNKNIHFTYHSGHGKKAVRLSHTWDKATAKWWKTRRDTTLYHHSGEELEIYTHKLTMGSSFWKKHEKEFYTYLSDKRHTRDSYKWDLASESWKKYARIEIGQNEEGKIEYYRAYIWNAQNGEWDFAGRANYSYDKERRLIDEKIYDEQDLKMRRYESTYQEDGYLKEIIEYQTYPVGQEWDKVKRFSFKYDQTGKLYREEEEFWEWGTQDWSLIAYKLIYGKTHQEALIEEVESIPLNCNFPNPYTAQTPFTCTEMISGKSYQLELLDLAARVVEVQSLIGDEIISLKAQLPEGVYILLIKDQSQVLAAEKIYVR